MNQNEAIVRELKAGRRLTALTCLHLVGSMKLASRLSEIRLKNPELIPYLRDRWITLDNGKRVKEYWLEHKKVSERQIERDLGWGWRE